MQRDIPDPASGGWHWDKRIPVALILAIVGQTAAGIWWASAISTRVARLEEDRAVPARVSVVETKIDNVQRQVNSIDRKMDLLIRRPAMGAGDQ